jgi:hypothetical protein
MKKLTVAMAAVLGGPGAERRRSVAQMGDDCGGGQPAPARHRLHRHLLPSQGGPRDAARGDGARASRPRARQQNPLFRRVELPRLAGRRTAPPGARGPASTGRW